MKVLRYFACVLVAWSALAMARGLGEEPPKGLDLNGTWQLNTALSDDAYKIVEAERARYLSRTRQRAMPVDGPADSPPGDSAGRPTEGSAQAPRGPAPQMRRSYRRDGLDELLLTPARMTIEHAAARFAFVTPRPAGGERRTEFRAGTRSVVSAVNGVADREVGWSRNAFVIATRAVEGLRKEERYQIDSDGRLRFTTEVRGEDIRKIVITRVYDRVIS